MTGDPHKPNLAEIIATLKWGSAQLVMDVLILIPPAPTPSTRTC